jgi:hypothetical protein
MGACSVSRCVIHIPSRRVHTGSARDVRRGACRKAGGQESVGVSPSPTTQIRYGMKMLALAHVRTDYGVAGGLPCVALPMASIRKAAPLPLDPPSSSNGDLGAGRAGRNHAHGRGGRMHCVPVYRHMRRVGGLLRAGS